MSHFEDERLYDPSADDIESTRVLNAASTAEASLDEDRDDNSSPAPPIAEMHTRWFILEPAVFLVFLAMNLSAAVYQNQILYQTCMAVFHYNETDCQPLLGVSKESPDAQRIEAEVQPYVARILMGRSLLESIIPAFVCLFIGPWSDKFGRRPIILTTFTGYFTGFAILSLLSFIATKVVVSPWIFLLSSVSSVLSGGKCALITGIFCYISDVAQEKARALRMVLNEASVCAGIMIGNIISGYLYAATNVATVFSISAILMIFALIYVYIFVGESLKPDQIHAGSRIREFFRFDLVKDLVRTCFRRRPSFDRAIIWLTMISLAMGVFIMEGDINIIYLFVRTKFDWTLTDFSLFNAARIVAQIFGCIVSMILQHRVLNISILTLNMVSIGSCVLESTVRATAVVWWEMYLGMGLGLMRSIMGPMSRALLSHVAPANEVGKIFALTTSLQSVSPLGAAPLYAIVYDLTLEYSPGIFNFISAGLYLLCYTLNAVIYGIQKSLVNNATYQAINS